MGRRHLPSLEKREGKKASTTRRTTSSCPRRRAAGKRGLARAQRWFYTRALATKVRARPTSAAHQLHRGRQPLLPPRHGGVEVALGDAGHELASLAPPTTSSRTSGGARTSRTDQPRADGAQRFDPASPSASRARPARRQEPGALPEGTRSRTGEMTDFLPSLGYLALHADVGSCPPTSRGAQGPAGGRDDSPPADLGVSFGPS